MMYNQRLLSGGNIKIWIRFPKTDLVVIQITSMAKLLYKADLGMCILLYEGLNSGKNR